MTGISVPRLSRKEIGVFVSGTIAAAVSAGAASWKPAEVSIALIGDDEMKSLNRRFRGRNSTTDVLTFPATEARSGSKREGNALGDIVISVDQARRQAKEEGHSLATEIRYLLVHGLIHAFGHDHATDDGEMDALELEVRTAVGLK